MPMIETIWAMDYLREFLDMVFYHGQFATVNGRQLHLFICHSEET
jgi:hypothetical protein